MVVCVANSWVYALKQFQTFDPDLVLMDAVMPDVDGFRLTRHIRARYPDRYVPIVFVTGLDDIGARERGISAGSDDFLTKPVDPVELRVRLRAMLRIRKLTQALEEKTRLLEEIAIRDPLTGTLNRRRFDECIVTEIERARRYELPLSLLVCDIDFFKKVNDTFGHAVGDEVIIFLGQLLSNSVRKPDLVFRYGGEEFVILAPQTSAARARTLAERIRSDFEQTSHQTAAGAQTISIGVSGIEHFDPKDPMEHLFQSADIALYRAKESGRNRVCLFDEVPADRVALATTATSPSLPQVMAKAPEVVDATVEIPVLSFDDEDEKKRVIDDDTVDRAS